MRWDAMSRWCWAKAWRRASSRPTLPRKRSAAPSPARDAAMKWHDWFWVVLAVLVCLPLVLLSRSLGKYGALGTASVGDETGSRGRGRPRYIKIWLSASQGVRDSDSGVVWRREMGLPHWKPDRRIIKRFITSKVEK